MQYSHPGTLICIEGIDGSGKSTLAKLLADSLQQSGYPIARLQSFFF